MTDENFDDLNSILHRLLELKPTAPDEDDELPQSVADLASLIAELLGMLEDSAEAEAVRNTLDKLWYAMTTEEQGEVQKYMERFFDE